MLTADTQLVSVDDHIVEHPTVWTDRLPAKWQEAGPRIVEQPNKTQAWSYDGEIYPMIFQGNAATRRFREEGGHGDDLYARHFDDMIPSAWDIAERVKAMEEDGVSAQLLFPTFPRFAGTMFLTAKDKELALLCVQAWNDWMIDEVCGSFPENYIPQVIVPLWDVELAAAEVRRTAAKGARSVAFCENPSPFGEPSFPTGYWTPFFRACEETEIVVSMHIGTSGSLARSSPEAPPSVGIALCGINSQLTLGELVMTDALKATPNVKLALSEGGAGWLPWALERLDYTWARSRYEGVQQHEKPSEIYARQFWTCIISDRVAIETREMIGVDKLMWESDFPHNDSNWPNSRKIFADMLIDVPDDEAKQLGEDNARALYRFPRTS
jgi:predicted TIM-barrel fold metal-dependent hydrolase